MEYNKHTEFLNEVTGSFGKPVDWSTIAKDKKYYGDEYHMINTVHRPDFDTRKKLILATERSLHVGKETYTYFYRPNDPRCFSYTITAFMRVDDKIRSSPLIMTASKIISPCVLDPAWTDEHESLWKNFTMTRYPTTSTNIPKKIREAIPFKKVDTVTASDIVWNLIDLSGALIREGCEGMITVESFANYDPNNLPKTKEDILKLMVGGRSFPLTEKDFFIKKWISV